MKRISFKDSQGLCLTQAVLSGRKTMTRRAIKGLPDHFVVGGRSISTGKWGVQLADGTRRWLHLPYEVGDVVAIQQAYIAINDSWMSAALRNELERSAGFKNKMFVKAELMPHHIRITDVRVERLRDILDEDCLREGILTELEFFVEEMPIYSYTFKGCQTWYNTPSDAFAALIDKVSGRGTWNSNPLVWCYSFELVD